MRFIAIAFLLLAYPALVALLRTNRQARDWAYFFLGVLPFTIAAWNLDAALVNWAAWPGYAKGMVITMEDSIALAIITTHRHPRGLPPLFGWLGAYIAAVALSIFFAGQPTAAMFYVFQLLRFGVLMLAIAKITADPRALLWLGMGLSGGMIYEAVVCIQQKMGGAFQTHGTLAHPNQLGMMAHFVILPILGMLLSGYRSKVLMLGVAASLIVVVLAASRATIGFVGIGVGLLLILSMRRQATAHKKRIITFAVLTMLVATPFLLNSINNRLGQLYQQDSGYDERAAFERAAEMMWADHPMGVGANNYVIVSNGGYSARAGVAWTSGSRGANVHNTYLLVAAETGWIGLFTYCALVIAVFVSGWRFSFGNRDDPRGDIALGSTIAVLMMALHSRYEWITLTYHVQYTIAISFGIIVGMVRLRAIEKKQARREKMAARAAIEPTGEPAIA